MGFKLPGKSMTSGTSAHSSALKMVAEQRAASALKKTYDQAYEDRGDIYKDMNKEDYIAEAKRQNKAYKETGKWDVKKSYKKSEPKQEVVKETTPSPEVKEEKQPRVEKTKDSYAYKDKTKKIRRKDGTVKKEVTKSMEKDDEGKWTEKEKSTFRKDGGIKKYVSKVKDPGSPGVKKHRSKTKVKYDEEGGVKRSKTVDVRGGRRTVTKTNKKGETTTRSRRTLGGILTGKGKKKEENSPAKQRILSASEKQIKKANKGMKDRREKKRNK